MSEKEERRSPAAARVAHQSLVEICGTEGGPSFEAETVDVSERGMHVRTAYLPEEGTPLVCRFRDGGREILAEGIVAWAHGEERGGDFGIRFTALDSGSVDVLAELARRGSADLDPASEDEEPAPTRVAAPEGERVRLHIDGLGAPMKARVRTTGRKRIDVGSNLEFLRVGRELTLETLEGGGRRAARIEGVDVKVDPGSGVPQLVVALRYQDVEETPEPSVIDREPPARRGADPLDDVDAHASGYDEHEDLDEEAQAMKGRLGVLAGKAESAARTVGDRMAKVGRGAAAGLTSLLRGAAVRAAELRRTEPATGAGAPRRTMVVPGQSSAAPPTRRAGAVGEARAAAPAADAGPPPAPAPRRRWAIGAGAAVALLSLGVLATRGPSPTPTSAAPAAAESLAAASSPAPSTPMQEEPSEPAAAPAAPRIAAPGGPVVADVPLFGPTPLATLEPAPLDPPEPGLAAPRASAGPAPLDDGARELALAQAAGGTPLADEAFPDEAPKPAKAADPSQVKPWGRGKVSEPTIHRLRLDAPGGALQGAITPTGFTVVVPGRKVMEGGKSITGRDARIAKVRTANTPAGAQIAFQFKDGVPGYRVRLKKDFVEFLISAPTRDAKAPAAGSKKKSHARSRG